MLPTLLLAATLAQSLPPVTTAPYSPEARAARLEGIANVWAEIDRLGKVVDAGLLQGLGMGLDEQAIQAVRKTQFPPQPQPVVAAIDVVYSLPQGPHWRIAHLGHRFNSADRDFDPTTRQAPVLTNPVLRVYQRPDDTACNSGAAVALSFTLSPQGIPADIETTGGAADTMRAWRFDPALRNGAPISVITDVLLKCAVPPDDDAAAVRVGATVSAPRLLIKSEPMYSEQARAAKLQGTVLIYAEISPYGYADHLRVLRPLGLGLDVQALDTVRRWKFAPGRRNGGAVSVQATIEVNFRLL
jgi:TonB family protein